MFLGRERVANLLADEKNKGVTVSPKPGDDDPSHQLFTTKDSFKYTTDLDELLAWKPDVVLVTLKAISNEDVFGQIKAKGPFSIPVVSLQNGAKNAEKIKKIVDTQVFDGMVGFNVVVDDVDPLHFYRTTEASLVIEDVPDSKFIVDIFQKALPGIFKPAPLIGEVQYGKLLINLNNANVALTNGTVLECIRDSYGRRLWAMSMFEATKILHSNGIKPGRYHPAIPVALFPYLLLMPSRVFSSGIGEMLFKVSPKSRPSMSNDFTSGAKTEVDFLQGEILRLGAAIDAKPGEMRYNHAVYELVKEAEKLRQSRGNDWRPRLQYKDILDWAEGKGQRPVFP